MSLFKKTICICVMLCCHALVKGALGVGKKAAKHMGTLVKSSEAEKVALRSDHVKRALFKSQNISIKSDDYIAFKKLPINKQKEGKMVELYLSGINQQETAIKKLLKRTDNGNIVIEAKDTSGQIVHYLVDKEKPRIVDRIKQAFSTKKPQTSVPLMHNIDEVDNAIILYANKGKGKSSFTEKVMPSDKESLRAFLDDFNSMKKNQNTKEYEGVSVDEIIKRITFKLKTLEKKDPKKGTEINVWYIDDDPFGMYVAGGGAAGVGGAGVYYEITNDNSDGDNKSNSHYADTEVQEQPKTD